MRAVKRQVASLLAFGNPREGAQVGQADLDRFPFHVPKRVAVERGMAGPDVVAGIVEHSDPVGDEMAFAMVRGLELARQPGRPTPAQSLGHSPEVSDAQL